MGLPSRIILLLWIVIKLQFSSQTCNEYSFSLMRCRPGYGCSNDWRANVTCENILVSNNINPSLHYTTQYTRPIWRLLFVNSSLPILSSTFFDTLTVHSVEELYLNNTRIEEIKRKSLNNIQGLQLLNLAENFITKLSHGTFDKLKELTYLNLSHNIITTMENDIFNNLRSISTIDLSYNNLSEVYPLIFHSTENLISLNIANNRIINLTLGTFDGLYKLQDLDLSNNFIFNLNYDIFLDLNSLQIIDISHNSKTLHLDSMIFNGKSMKSVKMNNNCVLVKDLIINLTSSIDYFDLSFNVPISVDYVNVKGALKFQHTIFKTKTVFGNLITELDLRSTMISLNPSSFEKAKNLEQLFLDNNNLKIINEDLFEGLVQLRYLSLANNSLSIVPTGVFRTLKNLQNLTLENNNILHLELGTFHSLCNLTNLNLSKNKFTYLNIGILYNLQNIVDINLSNNLLTSFDFEGLVHHLRRENQLLKIRLVLDNNFWLCNWLIKVVSLAWKNNFIIQEGNDHKKRNVNAIACMNVNTSSAVTSATKLITLLPKPLTSTNPVQISKSTPLKTTSQQKTINYIATTEIQETIKNGSEITTTEDPLPINKISSAVSQDHAVQEKYLFSSESNNHLSDLNVLPEIFKLISEFRVLLAFILFLQLVLIFSVLYFTFIKNIKHNFARKHNAFPSCNMELIESNKDDDHEA